MATKRKQQQPKEDLEATVAEILDNPIVKINLGFLNVGKPGSDDSSCNVGVDSPGLACEVRPMGLSPIPSGVIVKPIGAGAPPADVLDNPQWLPARSPFVAPPPIPPNDRPVEAVSVEQYPGDEASPMGLDDHRSEDRLGVGLRPMGFSGASEAVGSVAAALVWKDQARVEGFSFNSNPALKLFDQPRSVDVPGPMAESSPSGSDIKPSGLALEPMGPDKYVMGFGPNQSMFLAEQLGALFPAARVHRIRLAQDALSHVEEKVYDLLWGVKNQSRDSYRLSEFSLQRIANEGRLNIKTVRELLPRLIDKGFIGIEREADVRRNQPTQYRVWSYSAVLADQRSKNRLWFVKTGKGVFYARPVAVGVTGKDADPGDLEPMGVETKPSGVDQDATGYDSKPMGSTVKPMGSDVGPMGVQISPGLLSELSRCIRMGLGLLPDEPLLKALVEECRQKARLTDGEPASDEEILQFTEMKIRVLRHASKLRNPLAVLKSAVPECFIGQPLVEHRAAERARKGRELEELRRYEASLDEQDEDSKSENERLSDWERSKYPPA